MVQEVSEVSKELGLGMNGFEKFTKDPTKTRMRLKYRCLLKIFWVETRKLEFFGQNSRNDRYQMIQFIMQGKVVRKGKYA